jgi:uncharacterized membrane protein
LEPRQTLNERVAVLETKLEATQKQLQSIERKLDELLELKSKGMGAIGLVSLIAGSGVIGVIVMIVSFFSGKDHL